MNPIQVKSLFIKFFGEKFKLYGLLVNLISVRYIKETKKHEFYLEISNPNNISYYKVPFGWEITEMLKEFESYVPITSEFIIDFVDNGSELYFNEEKTKEINNAFNQVNTIRFKIKRFGDGYDYYVINIKSVGVQRYYDYDDIRLNNLIEPLKSTKNGEPCDVNDAVVVYFDEFLPLNEPYWESESLYMPLDQIFESIPSIGGSDIVLSYSSLFV